MTLSSREEEEQEKESWDLVVNHIYQSFIYSSLIVKLNTKKRLEFAECNRKESICRIKWNNVVNKYRDLSLLLSDRQDIDKHSTVTSLNFDLEMSNMPMDDPLEMPRWFEWLLEESLPSYRCPFSHQLSTFQLFIAIECTTTPISGCNSWFRLSHRCRNTETCISFDQLSFHIGHCILLRSIVEGDSIHRHHMAQFSSPRISGKCSRSAANRIRDAASYLLRCCIDVVGLKFERSGITSIWRKSFTADEEDTFIFLDHFTEEKTQ